MARFDVEQALAASDTTTSGFDVSEALTGRKKPSVGRMSGREMPSPAQGFVTAMQGPLFGFLDEITGGIQGAYTMMDTGDWEKTKQSYRENRDLIRGMEEQYKQDYPTLSRVAPAMASAPLFVGGPQYVMGPKAGATAGQQLARDMIGAGVTAAGYGALTAAGESEADDTTNLLNDILLRGAQSASTGAAAVPVLRGIGAITGAGVRMLPERVTSGGGKAPLGPLTPAGVGPESFAERKVAEQLIRDLPITNIKKTSAIPTSNIKKPLDRALAYQRWMGKEARMVDVGDENTADLLRLMANMPGQTKNALKAAVQQRQAGRGEAIVKAADKALGTGGAQYKQSIDDMIAARDAASKPLYDQLKATQVVVDDELSQILEAARQLGAFGMAKKSAIARQRGFSLTGDPVPVGATIDAADVDLVKRGLDQLINKQTDQVTGKVSPLGGDYTSLVSSLRNKMDDLTTDPNTGVSLYKTARDAFAGPTRLKELSEMGLKSLQPDNAWKFADIMANAGASERDALRLGILQAIRNKAGDQGGQTWLMNNWKNPNVKEKIQIAFGPDAPKFIAALQKQLKMKGMEGLRGGSQTGKLAFSAEDAGIEPLQNIGAAVATAKAGEPSGLMAAIGSLYRRGQLPEPVRNRIGQILLMKGPQATQELIKMGQLLELIQKQQQAQAGAVGAFAGRNPWLTQEPNQ